MSEYNSITLEIVNDVIARIMLNAPHKANAQDTNMLYELNHAMDHAAHNDDVRVILLGSHGKHFSAGHDLREQSIYQAMENYKTVGTSGGFKNDGIEGHMSREEEIYFGFSERWRNIPKPTIAAVHGKCIAGGLMIMWPFDIILASEDATFCDPTINFGMPGGEYFMLPWEISPRKAKELLFTASELSAQEALSLGMINRITSTEELQTEAINLANSISKKSAFALKLTKQSVNFSQDCQGRLGGLHQAFANHQLAHSHNLKKFDLLLDPTELPEKTQKAMSNN